MSINSTVTELGRSLTQDKRVLREYIYISFLLMFFWVPPLPFVFLVTESGKGKKKKKGKEKEIPE